MDHSKTAFQLGMDLGQAPRDTDPTGTAPRKAQAEVSSHHSADAAIVHGPWGKQAHADCPSLDHFKRKNGRVFAGSHLIVDLWGASRLDDIGHIDRTLRAAVEASKATLLHLHLHHFGEGGGVSGVAVLAESHISIHTWPERDYAALDVFMCGDADPDAAIPVLEDAFSPSGVEVEEIYRGEVETE